MYRILKVDKGNTFISYTQGFLQILRKSAHEKCRVYTKSATKKCIVTTKSATKKCKFTILCGNFNMSKVAVAPQ